MSADRNAILTRATPDDLPTLLSLVADFCVVDEHPFDARRVHDALLPLLEDDRYGVVWLVGEAACGYVVVTWGYSLESGGVEALLDEIFLRQRGQGLGSQVMGNLFEDLRRRGIQRMFLETEEANERARRFYARHGFSVEPSRWMSADI